MTQNPQEKSLDFTIAAVPLTLIDLVWGQVAPIVQRVVDIANGDLTLDNLYNRLITGQELLVIVTRNTTVIAANILNVETMDDGTRVLYIPVTAGDELELWMDKFLDVAKAIAKDFNCTELRGMACRKGWLKKLKSKGWTEVHTVIRCELGE